MYLGTLLGIVLDVLLTFIPAALIALGVAALVTIARKRKLKDMNRSIPILAAVILTVLALIPSFVKEMEREQARREGASSIAEPKQQKQVEEKSLNEAAKALGADSSRLSEHDWNAFREIGKLQREWNVLIAPMARDLLDPNVSGEVWVKGSTPIIEKMRSIHRSMMGYAISIEDKGLRATAMKLVENNRAKLLAMTQMHIAVANGDVEGQQAAGQALNKAGSEGTAMALELMEKLRTFSDGDMLLREMQERTNEIDEALKKKP